ncbi:hypothetical protein LCGC14_0540090 [marine sediment metagenome]|uniref:DUF2116 family Zn-ribbon domain-containing protein n=1 Tax=marine sediment metagenome TaxID=412755 RepID=A0A0F9SBF3_9ZZZZ
MLTDIKRHIRCNNCGKFIKRSRVGSCCSDECQKEFNNKNIYGCLTKNEKIF